MVIIEPRPGIQSLLVTVLDQFAEIASVMLAGQVGKTALMREMPYEVVYPGCL